jgi:hypothetical protein
MPKEDPNSIKSQFLPNRKWSCGCLNRLPALPEMEQVPCPSCTVKENSQQK